VCDFSVRGRRRCHGRRTPNGTQLIGTFVAKASPLEAANMSQMPSLGDGKVLIFDFFEGPYLTKQREKVYQRRNVFVILVYRNNIYET
jgi:hypothetical protein